MAWHQLGVGDKLRDTDMPPQYIDIFPVVQDRAIVCLSTYVRVQQAWLITSRLGCCLCWSVSVLAFVSAADLEESDTQVVYIFATMLVVPGALPVAFHHSCADTTATPNRKGGGQSWDSSGHDLVMQT